MIHAPYTRTRAVTVCEHSSFLPTVLSCASFIPDTLNQNRRRFVVLQFIRVAKYSLLLPCLHLFYQFYGPFLLLLVTSSVTKVETHRGVRRSLLNPQSLYSVYSGYSEESVCVNSGRNSSVGIAARYGLDGPGIETRCGGGEVSAPVQTGPGAHPASCTVGIGSLPGVKRPGRGADPPPPSSLPRS